MWNKKNRTGAAFSGLQGLGGVGKTALALADRLKDQYPDAQFLIELRGTGDPVAQDPKNAQLRALRQYSLVESEN